MKWLSACLPVRTQVLWAYVNISAFGTIGPFRLRLLTIPFRSPCGLETSSLFTRRDILGFLVLTTKPPAYLHCFADLFLWFVTGWRKFAPRCYNQALPIYHSELTIRIPFKVSRTGSSNHFVIS